MDFNVHLAQRRLADAGYYKGVVDGIFGPLSWRALLLYVARRREAENDTLIARGMAKWLPSAKITTSLRVQHFLAQLAIESGGFVRLVENLNYSSERLQKVWAGRFPNRASTAGFAHNPEALANKVYANRLGNGDAASGDGWRYRGRGLIQLTGGSNYAEAQKATGLKLLSDPDLAAIPANAVQIATWFWTSRGINAVADRDNLPGVRKLVNGGTHGLADAQTYLFRARAVLQ